MESPVTGGCSTARIRLRTPPSFSFWRTVYSHGWCALPPFAYDSHAERLERTLRLSDGTLVHCSLRGVSGTVSIHAESKAALSADQRREAARQLRSCLRLDEDFAAFHVEATRRPEHRWIARAGAGRLLRAPTVFEDAVKMLCTTNCTWALTTLMVSNLVRIAGERLDGQHIAFPTPASVAALPERTLRSDVRAGYRSPYLLEFAQAAASGTIDVESWRTSTLSTPDLFRLVKSVKGIGPYAAGNLLKLLGRYDELGLDSWVRKQFSTLHAGGRVVKDRTIERHYKKLGEWRGLFFWMEMTKEWHEKKFVL